MYEEEFLKVGEKVIPTNNENEEESIKRPKKRSFFDLARVCEIYDKEDKTYDEEDIIYYGNINM